MFKKAVLYFILSLGIFARAQNLVLNPSFEQHVSCPTSYSQINLCNDWFDASPSSTCDYYSASNCSGNFSPPLIIYNSSLHFYQQPLSGQSYAGILPFFSGGSLREFLQGSFVSQLSAGILYYMEFYINAMGNQKFFIHDISALVTDTSGFVNPDSLQNYTPQILPGTNIIYSDTGRWMRIGGYYQAHGGERFITIGNFTPYGQEIKDSTISPYAYSAYFIDSVGVYEVTQWDVWNAGPDKTINYGDSVQIGNPCTDYSMFSWVTNTGGTTYLSDSTMPYIWSKPPVTTTYYVTKTQGTNVFKDTVVVNVTGNPEIRTFVRDQHVRLYPNPNNGVFAVDYNLKESATIEITDISGKLVGKYNLPANSYKLQITNEQVENGVYLYRIVSSGSLVKTGKIIVMK